MPFAAQAVVALVQNPTANMLPLGLVLFGFYGAVCLIPALAGARLLRWVERKRAGAET